MGQQEAGPEMGSSEKVVFHSCAHCLCWVDWWIYSVAPAQSWSPGCESSPCQTGRCWQGLGVMSTQPDLACLGYKGHDLSCHQLLEPNSPWLQRTLYVCVRNRGKVRARLLHITKIWIHRFNLEQGLCNKTKWNNIKAGNWNGLQYYWRKGTNSLTEKWHTD